MTRPKSISEYPKIDLKLGIKSSITDTKSFISAITMLYMSDNKPAQIQYSQASGTSIVATATIENALKAYMSSTYRSKGITDTEFIDKINSSPIFKAQIEHLNVGSELIWRLGRFIFINSIQNMSAERAGTTRFPKEIVFSSNMDIISSLIKMDEPNYKEVLLSWLGLGKIISGTPVETAETNLKQVLNVFAENAFFKLRDGDKDVIFNQSGIYDALNISTNVDINGDEESKGSLRIIKKALSDGLNPYLSCHGGTVSEIPATSTERIKYQSRVNCLLSLSSVKIPHFSVAKAIVYSTGFTPDYNLPRNRIVFGAPGTGKSFRLNEDRKNKLKVSVSDFERVTFHSDYTYAQFIGTYKPSTSSNGDIEYSFVPGPFVRILKKAYENIINATDSAGKVDKSKIRPFLIIIEEINRAHAAAVFGDIFQLLDRGDDNTSEYDIQMSEDLRKYLQSELGNCIGDSIKIPDNLYIWATMNSADQGVFPIDTAFKRRWSFEYIGIDDEEFRVVTDSKTGAKTAIECQSGKFTLADGEIEWNVLRRALNYKLSSNRVKVQEDKLMGPFFMKTQDSIGTIIFPAGSKDEDFIKLFCEKVIMYLFEDAAKSKRKDMFDGCDPNRQNRFSFICEDFRAKGLVIFGSDFRNKIYSEQMAERDAIKKQKEL